MSQSEIRQLLHKNVLVVFLTVINRCSFVARALHTYSFTPDFIFLADALDGEWGDCGGVRCGGWRCSAHAHLSYPRQSLLAPEFNPYIAREEGRVQGLDCTSGEFAGFLLHQYIKPGWVTRSFKSSFISALDDGAV